MSHPAARLVLGLAVFVLLGWGVGALAGVLLGTGWAMFVAGCVPETTVR
jgi:hypothetical protein